MIRAKYIGKEPTRVRLVPNGEKENVKKGDTVELHESIAKDLRSSYGDLWHFLSPLPEDEKDKKGEEARQEKLLKRVQELEEFKESKEKWENAYLDLETRILETEDWGAFETFKSELAAQKKEREGGDEEATEEHILTEEDLEKNPELAAKYKTGETITVPVGTFGDGEEKVQKKGFLAKLLGE